MKDISNNIKDTIAIMRRGMYDCVLGVEHDFATDEFSECALNEISMSFYMCFRCIAVSKVGFKNFG